MRSPLLDAERYDEQDEATSHKNQAITYRIIRMLTEEHIERRQCDEQDGNLAEGFFDPLDTLGVQLHG
jgi:hypothetical protein